MRKFWIIAVVSAMFLAMASGQLVPIPSKICCETAANRMCAQRWSLLIPNCESDAQRLCANDRWPRTSTGCRNALRPLCAQLPGGRRGGYQAVCQFAARQMCDLPDNGCKKT